jgi:ABC-type multidrug transport system ATPase subunit
MLPNSFDTVLDPRLYLGAQKYSLSLSGGQWQRIALSRGFMRLESADLLLLDEPSASLDPEAEFKLFKALKEARKGRTTVYISHRFNTVRAANRIMVIENGELVEIGTHDELNARNGRYKYLYGLQTDALADDDTKTVSGEQDKKELEPAKGTENESAGEASSDAEESADNFVDVDEIDTSQWQEDQSYDRPTYE